MRDACSDRYPFLDWNLLSVSVALWPYHECALVPADPCLPCSTASRRWQTAGAPWQRRPHVRPPGQARNTPPHNSSCAGSILERWPRPIPSPRVGGPSVQWIQARTGQRSTRPGRARRRSTSRCLRSELLPPPYSSREAESPLSARRDTATLQEIALEEAPFPVQQGSIHPWRRSSGPLPPALALTGYARPAVPSAIGWRPTLAMPSAPPLAVRGAARTPARLDGYIPGIPCTLGAKKSRETKPRRTSFGPAIDSSKPATAGCGHGASHSEPGCFPLGSSFLPALWF